MQEQQFYYSLQLRLCKGEDGSGKFFGSGVVQLMLLIDQYHSLHRATEEMGIAYSKAWRILKTAESNLGFPLLHKTIGGTGGGGSTLTAEGREFLGRYQRFLKAVGENADKLFADFF